MKIDSNKKNYGKHLIADLYDCDFDFYINKNSCKQIVNDIWKIIKEQNLHSLSNSYHEFWKNAFTVVFSLVESHLSIHTWPEDEYITLDIFVCNYENDNSEKVDLIFEKICNLFKAERIDKHILTRWKLFKYHDNFSTHLTQ